MSTTSDSSGSPSALITYTKSGETHQSASSTSKQEYDFLDFLGVAQSLEIYFLPIKWQPALNKIGAGGTAEIRQALINIQTTFAFKRLRHPQSVMEESRNLRALIAEISILGHPAIRHHPNVANIVGICWDVVDGGEKVWPVLVFEKTRYGDLKRFMASGPGKELDFKNRLNMLFDVALAVRDLHAIDVIHGDIKPENILIFSGDNGRYMAKVIDFGYSTLFATDSDPITMPDSGVWTAPEKHQREILPRQARKMDAYSFNVLFLWLLFYNKATYRDNNFEQDVEDSQKNLSDYASEMMRTTPDLEDRNRDNLQRYFRSTLAQDPVERSVNFDEFLQFSSRQRASDLAPPTDKMFIPPEDFQITLSLYHLVDTHNGVRCYIAKCLEKRTDRPSTLSQCHTLNLAFCYHLGFGVRQDMVKSRLFLDANNVSIRDLEHKIEQVKNDRSKCHFPNGIFGDLYHQFHIKKLDPSEQYREEQGLRKAEAQYQREVETMGPIFGDGHPLVQGLQIKMSDLIVSEGRWKDVEKLQLRMIEIDIKENDGQSVARLAPGLATTYMYQGRWKEAEEWQMKAMEWCVRGFGAEDLQTSDSKAALAVIYSYQGRWKEAKELQIQVVEIWKRTFGTEHPATLLNMSNLASIYGSQERWKEAEELCMQVMETMKRVLGTEHPSTLTSINNLASIYDKQERWKEAEELYMQVIETKKRVLGTEHPDTLISMSNMALLYAKQERLREAEELGIYVLKRMQKVFGADHPDTLIRANNLVGTYLCQNRMKEAECLQTQVTEATKRVFGEDHPHTLKNISDLARIYWKQGRCESGEWEKQERWKKAEELFVEVIETMKRVLGTEHSVTLRSMNVLAMIYEDQALWETEKLEEQELYRKAEELLVQVLETRKRVLGTEHPHTLESMRDLGWAYWNQGSVLSEMRARRQKGEELLMQVIETSKRVLGTEHSVTLKSMSMLAHIHTHIGGSKKRKRGCQHEQGGIDIQGRRAVGRSRKVRNTGHGEASTQRDCS